MSRTQIKCPICGAAFFSTVKVGKGRYVMLCNNIECGYYQDGMTVQDATDEFKKPVDDTDYLEEFDNFWKDIINPLDSHFISVDQVKRELYDYKEMMGNLSKVYEAIAGVCKPNTDPQYIIDAHEKAIADAIDEALREFKEIGGIDD